MSSFRNEYKISQIEFNQNIQCYCPLGEDFYTAQVNVVFSPNALIPDYCEIEKYLRSLSGKTMIIEELIGTIFEYINQELNPSTLSVVAEVSDAIHFPVKVTRNL